MNSIERKHAILSLANERSSVSVKELSKTLHVSEVTIRKLLNTLSRQGHLQRVRGGAVSLTFGEKERDMRTKERTNVRNKKKIGLMSYSLINNYDSIFLDAGSTTTELARCIREGYKKNIRIVTNAINIAMELVDAHDIEIVLTGGQLRHDLLSCVGPFAEKNIKNMFFDKAFIASNNVTLKHGATTPQPVEAQFKQFVVESAEKSYLLCDSSKFNGASFSKICSVEDFTAVITDNEIKEAVKTEYLNAGISLILAGKDSLL